MAGRFINPNPQFEDANGNPLSGGLLFFYATGTSTLATTYQDQALTTPNQNPIILESDARIGNCFLDPSITYKIVLQDKFGSTIYTSDQINNIGSSIIASFQIYPGNPNTHVAGNAGTINIRGADAVWDTNDNILFVCTATGTATAAVWSPTSTNAFTANEDVLTSDAAILVSDAGRIKTANKSTAIAFTLPTALAMGVAKFVSFKNIGAGTLTITPAGADTIEGQSNFALPRFNGAIVYSTGSTWRVLSSYTFGAQPIPLVDGATPAIDASRGTYFTLTTTTNPTIGIPSNPTPGQNIIIAITASGGARTASLNTGAGGFAFGSDITSLTATASGKTDMIGCKYDPTGNVWRVLAVTKGFSA